jgi:hypothetical protein
MATFNALYYPTWNPSPEFFRSALLFFDRLEVIVPENVEARYDESNSRVCELIPEAFGERRESHYEIDLTEDGWQRLGNAFDLIVEAKPPSSDMVIEVSKDGMVRFKGHVLTHDAKMSMRIQSMLKERKLLRTDMTKMARELFGRDGGFHVVDERASCLILALLADSQSRRHRLRTITDEPIPYSFNVLNAETSSNRHSVNAALASTIIKTEVPHAIGMLSPDDYVELRKRFEEVRQPFQRAVASMSDDNLLSSISDPATLQDAISQITSDYGKEVERLRRTLNWSGVKEWTPFGLTALATLPGLYTSVSSEGPLSLALAGLAGGVVQIGVTLYQQVVAAKNENDEQKSQRFFAGLRNELIDPNVLRRLTLER